MKPTNTEMKETKEKVTAKLGFEPATSQGRVHSRSCLATQPAKESPKRNGQRWQMLLFIIEHECNNDNVQTSLKDCSH